jgi:glutamate 5-kinase
MNPREKLKEKQKIVIKIGTSTISFPNGRLNLLRLERLVTVLAKVYQGGAKVVLVSSGAIAVGAGILGWDKKPDKLSDKQALAAVGQAELVKIYQKFFETYDQVVAQVLLTKDGILNPERRRNARNTMNTLLEMDILPIINENDTVSTHGIQFGNNDILSASVAALIEADLLIMLSDIDGLYSGDPRVIPDARIISTVSEISRDLGKVAKSTAGTSFGTGGMATKLDAVKLCSEVNIDTIITNGKDPEIIYDILEGKEVGTYFVANNSK